jgi:hypothetical protein
MKGVAALCPQILPGDLSAFLPVSSGGPARLFFKNPAKIIIVIKTDLIRNFMDGQLCGL